MKAFHGARTFICYAISPCTQLTKRKPNQAPIWKWTMHEKLGHQSDTASLEGVQKGRIWRQSCYLAFLEGEFKSYFLMNDYFQVFQLASMRWLELARPKLSSKIYVCGIQVQRDSSQENQPGAKKVIGQGLCSVQQLWHACLDCQLASIVMCFSWPSVTDESMTPQVVARITNHLEKLKQERKKLRIKSKEKKSQKKKRIGIGKVCNSVIFIQFIKNCLTNWKKNI